MLVKEKCLHGRGKNIQKSANTSCEECPHSYLFCGNETRISPLPWWESRDFPVPAKMRLRGRIMVRGIIPSSNIILE
jgi:hypothetical protein